LSGIKSGPGTTDPRQREGNSSPTGEIQHYNWSRFNHWHLILMSVLVGRLRLPILGANVLTVVICSILSFILADRIALKCTTRP